MSPRFPAWCAGFCLGVLSLAAAPLRPLDSAARASLAAEAFTAVRAASAPADTLPAPRILGSRLEGTRLSLDLGAEILAYGPGTLAFEHALAPLLEAAADILRPEFSAFEIYVTVAGIPLENIFAAAERPAVAAALPTLLPPPARAGLAGRRVAVSPGHGYYLLGSTYVLQRSFFSGIVEDFVNHDFITLLDGLLRESGSVVLPTRNLDRNAGLGETGFPKWQEAARYHLKALGADPSIWNEAGFTHLNQDIRCRPLWANSVNAEVLVSLHNNGGGGTGTETLYDTNNGFGPESRRLADALHARVIAAIRRDFNPAWADRRVQGFNGSYGENRLATRPAVILEIAFMDRPEPDNSALRNETFKRLVAAAIRDGLADFFAGAPATAPAAPAGLRAAPEAAAIALAWTDLATTETGYRVERRAGVSGSWAPLASLAANATAYRDAAVVPGTLYGYRVIAFNAAGDAAQFSNETEAAPVAALSLAPLRTVPPFTWGMGVATPVVVTDPAGRTVSGAVVAGQDSLGNRPFAPVLTDAEGRASFATAVPPGLAAGTYRLTFTATAPGYAAATATRDVLVEVPAGTVPGTPLFSVIPGDQTAPAGTAVTFTAAATGAGTLSYQWFRDGTALPGANQPALTLPRVGATDAGAYTVAAINALGRTVSPAAVLAVSPAAWLSNVSLRTTLAANQNVIVGFVVAGGTKELLVRAAGPALTGFGLAGAMPDPRLELFRGAVRLTANNDWPGSLAATTSGLGAFPFAAASRDAALLQPLAGDATVQVSGPAGGTVLIEGYDAGRGSAVRLVNLSARNRVGTGGDILIAGFFVAGTGTQRVLLRAVGPGLAPFGVTGLLADPKLELFDGAVRLAENDTWAADLAPTFASVGAFALPAGSRDAAFVATLPAGRSYTVQISGVGGATGEALVEVYELP
ncbi:MAG: hypothetical protein B9S34_06660 [Opitutia bacterium Tous-C1TDCM]|nr:MAG: hypothetical protein B9S34_06660 [Opitutae bacterium Tous-C1TDCM]